MRILILDANYPGFLDEIYLTNPRLDEAPYEVQRSAIRAGLFGEVGFQIDALRALGHEASSIITNALHAQRAWCRESGAPPPREHVWRSTRRRGLPWISRAPVDVDWEVVLAQVRQFRPDVIYVGILDSLPPSVVSALRPMARLVVAQIAASMPAWDYAGYDLVLSSIPGLVEKFRDMGIDTELVPLAFEPTVLDEVPPAAVRDIPLSFVGSFSEDHPERLAIVEAVARHMPVAIWTSSPDSIPPDSSLRQALQGAAFGREMYSVLARSRLALNTHSRVAGDDANNLRLFEATGMGALLLTEKRRNLGDLFDVGRELVAYGSPEEAAELALHYIRNPDEAVTIALAGQARTLRDHTWLRRMSHICDLMAPRLERPSVV